MARFHGGSFLVNEEGQPIEGADISIYLAGTEEPAYIFEDEFSGVPKNSVPQITSQENGYFEFWVPDVDEPLGYSPLQKFKIAGEKIGITEGGIDYIDVFPPTIPVNELDTDPRKMKAVSNLLAYNGETHRLDTSHIVHGIDEVDETSDLDSKKNKLVSDVLAYSWDKHVDKNITLSDNPHDIKPLDLTTSAPSGQYEYDRVISGYQGNLWDNHVNKGYSDSPHNIEQVDESDSDTEKNKLISNELARTLYHERAGLKRFNIFTVDWYVNSDGDYEVNIYHNMNEQFPMVQTGDLDYNEIVYIQNIWAVDDGNVRLINNTELNLKVIISG